MAEPSLARAWSFGDHPEQHDRARTSCLDHLFEELGASGPSDALDVGCGTGKVAIGLARRRWRVLGIESDAPMAAVARRAGIDVDTVTFEAFEAFDASAPRFEFERAGRFAATEVRTYPRARRPTTVQWIDLPPTHSDHRVLPSEVLERLLDGVGVTIDGPGGVPDVAYETVAILARPVS